MADQEHYSRTETTGARLDRNFGELLQELRVAQTGVQIIFAFLLSVPFQQRFTILTDGQRGIYIFTLVAAALSVILFTAPAAMHRVLFREGVKDFIVRYTSILLSVGLGTLGVTVLGGVVLVLDVLVGPAVAFSTGAALAAVALALWLGIPFWRRSMTPPGKTDRDVLPD
ncbi:hypothetical protein BA895_00300 [Humibacillus sp. DSM 29435]|uniref:DUF6328 family protein n=1 Tax=Humibacillus sp. DSM 29435 TaxID=1869167 RepID=UPI000871D33A|nr:DUF6328 family protein [Humibacillus sp. DSM 29435]OFE19013.1 hypothetical protein BA895_00300 [Humibacillus sp. DSM 29435]